MSSIYAAVDPGKDGALVAIRDGKCLAYWLTKHHFTASTGRGSQRDYMPRVMALTLDDLKRQDTLTVFLERQGARPNQGVTSMFSTGYGFGLWVGILAALGIPYHVVHPATWVSVMFKGMPGEGKDRAIHAAGRLLPDLDLIPERGRKPHLGLADAACLAVYGANFWKGDGRGTTEG